MRGMDQGKEIERERGMEGGRGRGRGGKGEREREGGGAKEFGRELSFRKVEK